MRFRRFLLAALVVVSLPLVATLALAAPPADPAPPTISKRGSHLVRAFVGAVGVPGFRDGPRAQALLDDPQALALSPDGQVMLMADGHTIRQIDLASGLVSTLAGMPHQPGATDASGRQARFDRPGGLAVAPDRSFALVADSGSHTIRRLDLASGQVTTVAGSAYRAGTQDGTGPAARFQSPTALALSADGRTAFIADTGNHALRQLDLASGAVTTMPTGSGELAGAPFAFPRSLARDGDQLYVLDGADRAEIRRIPLGGGPGTTIALRVLPPATLPDLNQAPALALTPDGRTLVVAGNDHTIRLVDVATGYVTTPAGESWEAGQAAGWNMTARFGSLAGIAISPDAGHLYVIDRTAATIYDVERAHQHHFPQIGVVGFGDEPAFQEGATNGQ